MTQDCLMLLQVMGYWRKTERLLKMLTLTNPKKVTQTISAKGPLTYSLSSLADGLSSVVMEIFKLLSHYIVRDLYLNFSGAHPMLIEIAQFPRTVSHVTTFSHVWERRRDLCKKPVSCRWGHRVNVCLQMNPRAPCSLKRLRKVHSRQNTNSQLLS